VLAHRAVSPDDGQVIILRRIGRSGQEMSFVIVAPDLVSAAVTDLENIGSTVSAASSAAAGSTTALLPAAEDEVSAAIAAVFGVHGKAFQAMSAQAAAFHEQFVNLLSAGAGAYLSTELGNAQQNLLGAVNGPVQGLLGWSAGARGTMGGAPAGLTAPRRAALPLLGGGRLGSILGTGAPVGQSINGVVAALQNGSAVSMLSGRIGAVSQSLSAGIAGLPTALTGLERPLGHGLLAPAASTGLASIAGPYETLFANTAANLQTLGSAIAANPAPFLHQFIINQIAYAQTIAAGVEYVIQNLPAVLASLPANIQAAIQALLAFDPAPFIQQFIANQMTYAQIIATSLQNSAQDFFAGLQELPAAFQSAVHAILAGDVSGAVSDIAQGFLGLLAPGVGTTVTGDPLVPPGLTISVTPTGTLGDLLPILTIPGMMAQNFTNLLPPGSIPAQISQNFTNVIDTLTNTSINVTALLGLGTSGLSATATGTFGLPVVLTIEALGAPVNALGALASSATAFIGDLDTGNLTGALGTLFDAPAVVTNAFLNGATTLPLSFSLPDFSTNLGNGPLLGTLSFTNGVADIDIPLDGLLVPETPITASLTGTASGNGVASIAAAALVNSQLPLNEDVGGTPISGLATGLLVFAPEQLALAITPA
jgi:PE family